MLIAYEFVLDELAENLQSHLIEKEAHWLCLHFNRIYQKSFQNNKLQDLQNWCNDILVKYPSKIFDSEDFITLQENALVSLISRDDLQMEENTLQNCLPHIRYFQMSGNDIINNVQPYHRIFEKNLWKDIMKKYMTNEPISSAVIPPRTIYKPTLPARIVESFSKVISETHASEIASWVDMKDDVYLVTENPYEFKLLLRGSRDGFNATSFWNLCDKQTHLVVVIKVKGTDEILGGYNPVGWVKQYDGEYRNCEESFIFSMKNGNIQNSISSRVKEPEEAIYCNSDYGPAFCCDLYMYEDFNQNGNCCISKSDSYEKPIKNDVDTSKISYFLLEEYEIFQIN
ncbi:hypothetical protein C2G38_2234328 [Gigaspora rosea]|uniref:TLDc domain-containing protein n=1 Tax=Gigaspora rosea TaxID=44941 RepID=A0A397TSM8_9GLOM|nr:hypothetical protein C2G38_2234330 [Gigaspora rosea]RIB00431.1 hypothetical protein C2G38_2234328 [Gigaspora rosea]